MVSRKVKLRIEAPVNGGRNYEEDTAHDAGRERNCSSVNKLGYMLESLSILSYEGEVGKSGFDPCYLWLVLATD